MDVQVSKLRVVSLGLVAENKALDKFTVEILLQEYNPMASGDATANADTEVAKGVNKEGVAYETSADVTSTVSATWLALGCPNRRTAPDVRRGDRVVVYQFADSDKYYWATYSQDINMRRLETVVWGFSGTKDEDAEPTKDNSYYFEISTHNGVVAFHTSAANGEITTFDVQLNTKDGILQIFDGFGNRFILDSTKARMTIVNSEDSYIDVFGRAISMQAADTIDLSTKDFSVTASNSMVFSANNSISTKTKTNTIEATTNHKGDFNVVGAFGLSGDMRTSAGGGGTGRIDIAADIHLDGSLRADGDVSAHRLLSDTQNV